MTGMPARWRRKAQSGATAIEFALVLPLFFLIFYGSLTYGLIFLAHLTLQHAAEDGVRAVLRAQDTEDADGNDLTVEQQLESRIAYAKSIAATQASWIDGFQTPTINVNVCLSDAVCDAAGGGAGGYPDCSQTVLCQVVMTVTYDYATHPIVPSLAGSGLGPMTPTTLQGSARVLIDGRVFTS
ncbi:TadE/TadG family type IV pilus assembly protein [Solimonas marina]|uniref:Pilus assembly protein n=1 Tax=Solimonas marina TaxID=2714601 RepID=A0A969WA51_9GAMM|nr:TadE/TadG family type IV pilus assembly protein [Solimonas marina]NKF22709.1 pilus assembly protein [Solimonas marina]